MEKWHVNKHGEPAKCRAMRGKCPLKTPHFESRAEAAAAAEKKLAEEFSPLTSRKKKAAKKVTTVVAIAFSMSGCYSDISLPESAYPPPESQSVSSKSQSASVNETLKQLSQLKVKGRAPKTGYSRNLYVSSGEFSKTRETILKRDLTDQKFNSKGKMASGTLDDPYSGESIYFKRGRGSDVDIDHVVALRDSWQKGAQKLSEEDRHALATDPDNLIAVDSGLNRQKGDKDAASWLPPNKAYRCTYVKKQVVVKTKYTLWVTPAEKDSMTRVLQKDC